MKKKSKQPAPAVEVKLDIGCGPNKKVGFTGIDAIKFDGVDIVHDVRKAPWPFKSSSVTEVHCSHFLEHLTGEERIGFFNELYRVMKPGAKGNFIVPHWGSGRAYGDPTHRWPPVVEMSFYYLSKDWRAANAPHVGFTCDFEVTWGYSVTPEFSARSQETQAFAVNHYRESAADMTFTVVRKP
jgi:ubiquinone/menaquinone biosynthesis C-methylase UbiE